MKLSLKNRLLKYVRKHYPEKIAKGFLQRLVAQETSYTPENVGRRLRELENEGLVKVSYQKGHAFYQAKEPENVVTYKVPALNKVIQEKIW